MKGLKNARSGPAFPTEVGNPPEDDAGRNFHQTGNNTAQFYGMSRREVVALEILKGLMLRFEQRQYTDGYAIQESFKLADEFISVGEAR